MVERSERPETGGPVVRLHSFQVPVRTQADFLAEFDSLLAAMRASRGYLGDETFLGGRNPRHVVLLSAWSSKRSCEAFFEAAATAASRRRLLFKYLEGSEFFRSRDGVSLSAIAAGVGRTARAL